jgi:hypothetical protein
MTFDVSQFERAAEQIGTIGRLMLEDPSGRRASAYTDTLDEPAHDEVSTLIGVATTVGMYLADHLAAHHPDQTPAQIWAEAVETIRHRFRAQFS